MILLKHVFKGLSSPQAFQKGSPITGDISQAILNITGGNTIIQIEKKWISDQNKCQNVGTITGSGRLTFDSFAGPIIATGVASTSSIVVALIFYFCKRKQVEAENCDSDPISLQEGIKDHGDEKFQWQEETGIRQTHGQIKRVMRNDSLVIYRGETIPGPQVSNSARF
jgi:glutamate receptor, ionotropic, plant